MQNLPNEYTQACISGMQALTALDSTAGAKSKDVRDSASRILGYAAAQLQQVEAIAGCLVDGLNRSEALAAAAAEVAQLACARFGDDRLVSSPAHKIFAFFAGLVPASAWLHP